MMFLFISAIILITEATQLRPSSDEIPLKPISLRLNIRPYNRLDKEVINFRECKEELATQYDTKCFYYWNGQNKDRNKYKMYI